ncbi:hypothetical protein J6590_044402 [Homalodisca vitripennis]|nr:hypothetical protein J6590_044402 [Homalodisca vitripennis]
MKRIEKYLENCNCFSKFTEARAGRRGVHGEIAKTQRSREGHTVWIGKQIDNWRGLPSTARGLSSKSVAWQCAVWCQCEMAKPDSPEGGGGGTRGLLAGLCVALGAVVALAVCVAYLDGRRQEQLSELTGQLETLRLLVDSMQKQLEQHEDKINSTVSHPSEH